MGERHLTGVVLQDIREGSLQHSGGAAGKAGCVAAQGRSVASCLNTDEADVGLINEVVESTEGVRSTTDAGHAPSRQPAVFFLHDLLFDLFANHAMEIAHHGGIGVSAEHAA